MDDTTAANAETKARGRPPVDIDLAKLEALSQMGCSNREIAAELGISERTLDARRRNPAIRERMVRGDSRGKAALRKKQMDMALAGDRTMLIWLGKQRLGQKDKVETSGKVDLPPPIIHVNFREPDAQPKPEAQPKE